MEAANRYTSNSGSENYEADEDYYGRNRGMTDNRGAPPGVYNDDDDYQDINQAYEAPIYKEKNYVANKPFKAAMNNPFTLTKLAGAKHDSPQESENQNQGGWESDEYQSSLYSSNLSRSRPTARAPPGLLQEADTPEDNNTSRNRSLMEAETGEAQQNTSNSLLKFKKTVKPRYNLFG